MDVSLTFTLHTGTMGDDATNIPVWLPVLLRAVGCLLPSSLVGVHNLLSFLK